MGVPVAMTTAVKAALKYLVGFLLVELFAFESVVHRIRPRPGFTALEELEQRSWIKYQLCKAYNHYLRRRIERESRSNEEYQHRFWSTFTDFYAAKAGEDFTNDYYREFDRLFERAVSTWRPVVCLDIGCGGFEHVRRLRRQHPHVQFIGNDLSDVSARAYESLKAHDWLEFRPGSIVRALDLFARIDMFYTIGTLMCLSGPEVEQVLDAVRRSGRRLVGLIVEPDGEELTGTTMQAADRSFRHNYRAYFDRYGLRIVERVRRPHLYHCEMPMAFALVVQDPKARRHTDEAVEASGH